MKLGRRGFLAMVTVPLLAETNEAVFEVLTAMASSLSEGNAAGFLKRLDHAMAGYFEIEANVNALTSQCEIVCSIDVLTEKMDGDQDRLELDWFLQLRAKAEDGPVERRRELVKLSLRKQGKNWKVTALEPKEVVGAMKVG